MLLLFRYVPSLRQLRQQAFVLTFHPTVSGRLAQMLMQVSDAITSEEYELQ